MSKFKKLIKLPTKDKIFVFRLFYLMGIFRAMMLLIPFKKLKKYLGTSKVESKQKLTEKNLSYIKKLRFFIIKVSNNTPWESKCLVQAMTAQCLLREKGLKTTLYLGVGKSGDIFESINSENMIAHAWIRCGEEFVTGGDGKGYAIVGKFTK